ncbi:MAG TPA: carboxypeptidase-like regulatory domain-containing protein [Terracidiphilus sp.]|nr:carboxypeptidase-like regulatory domain-containing protein [Terracidiphilus sp.]
MLKLRLMVLSACCVLFLIIGFPECMEGQTGTARLSGSVTDLNGAVIPGAAVVLQSTSESASRQTQTNSEGAYVIPAILPGQYQLKVTAEGFQAQTLTNISLISGQGSTLNVVLKVGAASASVVVTEATPLLDTTTATIGTALQEQQLTELPSVARNFSLLLLTLPSTVNITGDGGTGGPGGYGGLPVMYGIRPRYNNLTVDGFDSLVPEFNTIALYPPPEAIQEMKVDQVTDQGTSGWAPGSNISVTTKSGTNSYHADVWEFLRNNAMNAHDYFTPTVQTIKWNQFGFAGGGPIWIPHVISKKRGWYVFGYYEGIRSLKPTGWANQMPTDDEIGKTDPNYAIFPADTPIYNPYTTVVDANGAVVSRQQFPGNKIPLGPTNLCAPQPTCVNANSLALAQMWYPSPNLAPGVIPGANYLMSTPGHEPADQWSVRVDHQFGQKDNVYGRFSDWRDLPTWPNGTPISHYTNFTYAKNGTVSDTHTFTPTMVLTVRFGGLTYSNPQADVYDGQGDMAATAGTLDVFPAYEGKYKIIPYIGFNSYNGIDQYMGSNGPMHVWEWTADAQKIKGKHALSFGGAVIRSWFNTDNQTGTYINYSHLPTSVGNVGGDDFASYLLGLPDNAGRIVGETGAIMSGESYALYFQDSFRATSKLSINAGLRWVVAPPLHNQYGSGTISGETGEALWDITNPITKQPANAPRGLRATDWLNFSPRVGIAYQVAPKTVVHSSVGIFFVSLGDTAQYLQGNRGSWPIAFPQSVSSLNLGLPDAHFPDVFPGPAQGSTTPLACVLCLETATKDTRSPYIEEWSLSVQQAISNTLRFEADYVGNHGVKLGGGILDNVAEQPGTGPITDRQPFPQYSPFYTIGYNGFSSWYDGLTVQLDWRASHNLTFQINHAYQKALAESDQMSSGNQFGMGQVSPTRYNIALHKGDASYSIGQVFHANAIYEIPVKTHNVLADALIANWQLSGIVTADSGNPVFAVLSNDNENIGSAYGVLTEFPNINCNPTKGFKWSLEEAVNTSCYSMPAFGTRGNGRRYSVFGQGLRNTDASLTKRWMFGDRHSVNLRGDFFNMFNQHTFDPPNMNYGSDQFGTISSTSRQQGRQIQVSLKLHF